MSEPGVDWRFGLGYGTMALASSVSRGMGSFLNFFVDALSFEVLGGLYGSGSPV